VERDVDMGTNVSQKKKGILQSYVDLSGFDTVFLGLVVALVTIGMIMMFSASYVSASYNIKIPERNSAGEILKDSEGNTIYARDKYGNVKTDAYYYLRKQARFAVAGLALMFAASCVKYTFMKRLANFALAVSFLLLILVLIFPSEQGKDGFKRWLGIGSFSFQPSELAKFGLILFCAYSMEKYQKIIDQNKKKIGSVSVPLSVSMILYLAITVSMGLLINEGDHLSGAVLIFAIGVTMTYLGGERSKPFLVFLILLGICVVFLLLAPTLVKKLHDDPNDPNDLVDKIIGLLDEMGETGRRIRAWMFKYNDERDSRWQTNQSLSAIGSGGLKGRGFGNSQQKYRNMPELHTDFIFAIVCEELGFLGAAGILGLFVLLLRRGFFIAKRAKDRFSSLLVMGIMVQVGLQVILHVAVVTDTIPNTGIGLPFFSYGGTSLVMLLSEMGVVLSVSKHANLTKKRKAHGKVFDGIKGDLNKKEHMAELRGAGRF